jgi:hypothetical protein
LADYDCFAPESGRESQHLFTAEIDPGRVETFVLFLCGGLVGAVARLAWIYSVLCPDRLIGAEN